MDSKQRDNCLRGPSDPPDYLINPNQRSKNLTKKDIMLGKLNARLIKKPVCFTNQEPRGLLVNENNDKSIESSCYSILNNFTNKNRIKIDISGKIFQILPEDNYKIRVLKLCGLIMVGILAHMIRQFPYYPITIIGNTVYSKVIAASLISYNSNNVIAICKSNKRISYYETDDGKELPFEGCSVNFFLNSDKSRIIPVVPNSMEDLTKLEQHTGLKDLSQIQQSILSQFKKENSADIYLANLEDLIINDEPTSNSLRNISPKSVSIHNPVIQIRKFWGNLYYIMTSNEVWLTRMVISDSAAPLQPHEVVSGLYGTIIPRSNPSYSIDINNNVCSITEPTMKTVLQRQNSYIVGIDFSIKSLHIEAQQSSITKGSTVPFSKLNTGFQLAKRPSVVSQPSDEAGLQLDQELGISQWTTESVIYNLQKPRPFSKQSKDNGIYLVHPFHLPPSWDPFLTIMIIARALVRGLDIS